MTQLLMIDDSQIEHLIVTKMLGKCAAFPGAWHSQDARASLHMLSRNLSCAEKLPDVILLDLSMPDFTGWDFLNAFQELSPKIPKAIDIYIYSSSIDPADKKLHLRYDFIKGHLSKPTQLLELSELYASYN